MLGEQRTQHIVLVHSERPPIQSGGLTGCGSSITKEPGETVQKQCPITQNPTSTSGQSRSLLQDTFRSQSSTQLTLIHRASFQGSFQLAQLIPYTLIGQFWCQIEMISSWTLPCILKAPLSAGHRHYVIKDRRSDEDHNAVRSERLWSLS